MKTQVGRIRANQLPANREPGERPAGRDWSLALQAGETGMHTNTNSALTRPGAVTTSDKGIITD